MRPLRKKEFVERRHKRLRQKVRGTAARPRLAVSFTSKNIYAQVIDDIAHKTLVYVSTLDKSFGDKKPKANKEGAVVIGKAVGQRALEKGIKTVVFDRGGHRYLVSEKGKNRVASLADAAREAGVKF